MALPSGTGVIKRAWPILCVLGLTAALATASYLATGDTEADTASWIDPTPRKSSTTASDTLYIASTDTPSAKGGGNGGGKGGGNNPPPGDLTIQNENRYPTRLAYGPDGKVYVSDAKVGSVFIYDANLTLVGELKDLARPLAVGVDGKGRIYVGNNDRNNVEVYSPDGALLSEIGTGSVPMPTDLAFDRAGNLYIADSLSDTVWVYDAKGRFKLGIGEPGDADGQLKFPTAVTVGYRTLPDGSTVGELYVGDQGHFKVQVFDLQGTFLRSFGGPAPAFSSTFQGLFVKIQSLALDANGRLHAADSYMNKVQILDPIAGTYQTHYGSFGTQAGGLNVVLDIAITPTGQVLAANAGNRRVEAIYTIP